MPSNDYHDPTYYYSPTPSRLETPPPLSQFHRPWSPESLDPHTMSPSVQSIRPIDGAASRDIYGRRHREVSDASVEALDLADYAATLRWSHSPSSNFQSPYPPFHASDQYSYLPMTPPPRLFTRTVTPQSSIPSLTSPGALSEQSHDSSYPLTPRHRPFSVQSGPAIWNHPTSDMQYGSPSLPRSPADQKIEADIATFPNWSQPWYDHDKQQDQQESLLSSPYDVGPSSQSHQSLNFSPTAHYSSADGSHRNTLFPWSAGHDLTGVTSETKEERMRMLEQEFGPNAGAGQAALALNNVDEPQHVIGSVDAKGNLITVGPKKRLITRLIQGIFACGQLVASLYSAVLLKPTSPPPPQGTVPAYGLYILSVLTILAMIVVFIFRPCCCAGRPGKTMPHEGPNGMMVLPVQSLPGARNGNGKKNKGGRYQSKGEQQAVQVNLIVDPSMFGGSSNRRAGDNEAERDEENGGLAERGEIRRRKGLFEGLKEEAQWKAARVLLKRMLYFDIAVMILWAVEFVLMLRGKRCPSGQFDGWCKGYNVATALACLLVLVFGLSGFFDIKDLHASKVSPRSRT